MLFSSSHLAIITVPVASVLLTSSAPVLHLHADIVWSKFCRCSKANDRHTKKVKVAHTRLPSTGLRRRSRFLAVSLQVVWVINPAVGWHYFPPGPQLPSQCLRGLLPILLLGEEAQWVWTVWLRLLPNSVATAIWTQALLCLSPAC